MKRAALTLVCLAIAAAACTTAGGAAPTTSPGATTRPASTSTQPIATPPTTPASTTTTAPVTTTTSTTTTSTTTLPPPAPWFLAWSSGTLQDDFAAELAGIAGVEAVSVVDVGIAHLVSSRAGDTVVDQPLAGFVIPLEAMRIDRATYLEFVPEDVGRVLAALGPTEVALGAASAAFRGLGVGDIMEFEDGGEVTVGAVIDDAYVGAAEVLTSATGPAIIVAAVPRYTVVQFDGDREMLHAAAASAFDYPVRIAGEKDTPVFRHADAVLPQITVKERFGEFAYKPGNGGRFDPDPAWLAESIVRVEIPLLGETRCHKVTAALLAEGMNQLIARGDADAVDGAEFKGCWVPRFIADFRGISRHAWGIAADINFFNPVGSPGGPDDPRLIEVLAALGFTNGRNWLEPDPGHFEWYGDDPPQ